MSHEIETRIGHVRRRARRLLLVYALSWVVALVVAATLALTLADYWIHFRDPGLRVLSLLAVLTVLVWAAFRYLRPVLRRRLDDVSIAQKIEGHFPALADRLSSSIEFLKTPASDHHAGSPALRQLVIAGTADAVKDLDLTAVLERRPTRRALAGASLVVAAAVAAVLFDPHSARLALARLVNPLSAAAWPRQHDLAFRDPPTRVPAGQTFEVELVDSHGHALPEAVRIHYRYDSGAESIEEVENMHLLGGVMVARKENVTRPFEYRAEGGDDDTMAWHELAVVEPPRIESLAATLYPPAYTHWPSEPTENNLYALRGSRVAFSGVATRPLHSATFKQDNGPAIPCQVSADGRHFELPLADDPATSFVVDKSGQYGFELEDTEGVVGGSDNRWEIHAVPDNPPTVTVERPGAAALVTPAAVVRLKAVAKDDLGIRQVALHFHPAATEGAGDAAPASEVDVPLFVAPQSEAEPTGSSSAALAAGLPGDSRAVEYRWDLGKLGLAAGSQMTFAVSATDAAGQTGRSSERRLIVITPEELADRLAQRQELILAELRRVLKVEREAEGQTSRLSIQLGEVGHLTKGDIDQARATELTQRHIARTLADSNEGIPAQINDLLADLASNQIESGETVERMRKILATIEQVQREHLTAAERGLTFAVKAAQADLAEAAARGEADFAQSAAVAPALTDVDQHQLGVIRALEEMLTGLGQWDSYRRFARDLAQLEHDEAEVQEETKRLGPELLGKQWKDLAPQQQADLKKLASRQAELGRQFDKLLAGMDDAAQRLADDDPEAAARVGDAAKLARQQGTIGRMRAAGEGLSRNQLGQAAAAAAQVRKDLSEMLETLTARRENGLEQLVAKLRQAEEQLSALRGAHQALREEWSPPLKKPPADRTADDKAQLDRLGRQQRSLAEEIGRLARRLEQLQADAAGRSTSKAAGEAKKQSDSAQTEDANQAEEAAAAAQEDLAKAQQQLAQRRRQAEADLAREQMNQLQRAVTLWHERETQLLTETETFERTKPAEQPPGQNAQAAQPLAEAQRALENEMRQQIGKLSGAEVFALALTGAARDMARAADELQRGQTGPPAQQAEADAVAALARLLAALAPSKPKEGGDNAPQGQQPGNAQQGKGSAVSLAEIKLLKLMQEDLNARYQRLRQAERSPQAAAEMAELAAEQGRLAELTLKLSQAAHDNANDDGDEQPAEPPRKPISREDPL